ncbi:MULTISPECIES: hypothetical protein [Citrobacter]|uniref:Uncharacterized protein n=1 Tax=Citrobacter werkmanii TaxID=67827 RepID=A0AA37Z3R5_9ENTR|nr:MULTISPECIES: hypothetical protein [Citrobacter]EGT0637770.1 hypothetical protein [Citrobacter werkmanii]EGT0670844.1 hypothetical protein [Citrobacter werkmanii]MBJ8364258.1 hypothetical protein [Citrobacter cronae]MBJ8414894.1 hypothetical protein [Citrobacter cronae]MCM8843898.1 hypothetical protein [Citrobacter cronae]
MSQEPTAGQFFWGIILFVITAIPLGCIGVAMLVMAQGIERWSGLVFLAVAFGISQSIWRKLSGK